MNRIVGWLCSFSGFQADPTYSILRIVSTRKSECVQITEQSRFLNVRMLHRVHRFRINRAKCD